MHLPKLPSKHHFTGLKELLYQYHLLGSYIWYGLCNIIHCVAANQINVLESKGIDLISWVYSFGYNQSDMWLYTLSDLGCTKIIAIEIQGIIWYYTPSNMKQVMTDTASTYMWFQRSIFSVSISWCKIIMLVVLWWKMLARSVATHRYYIPALATYQIDGLVQDCSNSIASALELLQSCTKPSRCYYLITLSFVEAARCDCPNVGDANPWIMHLKYIWHETAQTCR